MDIEASKKKREEFLVALYGLADGDASRGIEQGDLAKAIGVDERECGKITTYLLNEQLIRTQMGSGGPIVYLDHNGLKRAEGFIESSGAPAISKPGDTDETANRVVFGNRWRALGRGPSKSEGQADVYRVRDESGKERGDHALKIYRRRSHSTERAHREIEALKRLKHDAIVPLKDFFEHEGRPCFVMPWCSGTLTDKKALFTENPEKVLRVFARICEAVSFCHAQNLIHRDIKPNNILMDDREGEKPLLSDFGICFMEDGAELTMTDEVMGGRYYTAPELYRGEDATAQSDIYSLGKLLYFMLCGKHLTHDDLSLLPPEFERTGSYLRLIKERIFRESISDQPRDRFGSVSELVCACGEVQNVLRRDPHPIEEGASCPFCGIGFLLGLWDFRLLTGGAIVQTPDGGRDYRGLKLVEAKLSALRDIPTTRRRGIVRPIVDGFICTECHGILYRASELGTHQGGDLELAKTAVVARYSLGVPLFEEDFENADAFNQRWEVKGLDPKISDGKCKVSLSKEGTAMVLKSETWRNWCVRCEFRFLEETMNDFSLIFRHDGKQFYNLACCPKEERSDKKMKLYRFNVSKLEGDPIANAEAAMDDGKLHILSIAAIGEIVACALDGKVLLTNMGIGASPGRIGFRGDRSSVEIRSFKVMKA